MRTWLLALGFVYVPVAAAQSLHTVQLVNDTRSQIMSFWIAPAGSHAWTKIDLTSRSFEYGNAYVIGWKDDQGCLRDFRTQLSDGRTMRATDFDVCQRHVYRAGVPFRKGHPGTAILP